MKNILVGITGAVSAAEMPSFIFRIRKQLDANVVVITSKNATQFVTERALRIYSGNQVFSDMYDSGPKVLVPHIELTTDADIFVVMPASSNIIAKVANGFSDDLISLTILAAACPVLFIPAMNPRMWFSSAVQQNVNKLGAHGYHVISPQKIDESSDKDESRENLYSLKSASLKSILLLLKDFFS